MPRRRSISITATRDALGITESRFYDWQKKDEDFREELARARAKGKIALVRQILSDKDWRAKAWYLERCWPNEFGRSAERPLPPRPPEPPPDLSKSIRVTCYGAPDVDLMQFMEMKAKLEAAGVKTDFPFAETPEELAKIQARRMAGGYRADDDEPESDDDKGFDARFGGVGPTLR